MSRKRAIKSAERVTTELGKLFASLGTSEHPRGAILSAYRNAHRGLRDVIRRNALREVDEVLFFLNRNVGAAVDKSLIRAILIGRQAAATQLTQYGLTAIEPAINYIPIGDSWMDIVRGQIKRVGAHLLTGGDPVLIIGDALRQGIIRPAPVIQQGTRWLAMLANETWEQGIQATSQRAGIVFQRQAIAAIDEKTTDCCLQVHGQVIEMDAAFHLTGTPRFADHVKDPPFHWNCRTSQVLVRPGEGDDELTRAMISAASLEESRRIKEEPPGVGPVSALGRG